MKGITGHKAISLIITQTRREIGLVCIFISMMSCISFNLVISKDFWSLILCIIFILIWTKTKTFYCFKFSNSKLVSILLDLKRNNNTSSKRIGLKYLYLLCKYLHSVYWYAKQNASFSSNICVCLKKYWPQFL